MNFSINHTRARAGVAPLTNALIENVWDAGYWDHAQGKTVCKKMNMLDEIRRERACELFGEGFRMDDLKRWGMLDTQEGINELKSRDVDFNNFVIGKHRRLPIPQYEIDQSDGQLTQNPMY